MGLLHKQGGLVRLVPSLFVTGLCLTGALLAAPAELIPTSPSPQSDAVQSIANPTLRWTLETNSLVTNGGFEAAISAPWMTSNALSRSWVREATGETSYEGVWVATQSASGPPEAELFQEVELSAEADYATLFWAERAVAYTGARDQQAFLRLEVRDTADRLLRQLAILEPEPNQLSLWQHRSADLTPWLGHKVRVAFVAGTGTSGTWRVKLDAVRVVAGSTNGIAYDVYFGVSTNLDAANLLGRTSSPSLTLSRLAPNSTNYWRVNVISAQTNTAGPVWRFTVGPLQSLHHLSFSDINTPQLTNIPVPITLNAEDVFNNRLTNVISPVQLAGYSETIRPPTVVISEVVGSTRDGIEFMNVSGVTQDLSGWSVCVYGGTSGGQPSFTFTLPAGTQVAPGHLFVLRESGSGPLLAVPEFTVPSINWSSGTNISASVLLLDAAANIVDFVTIGNRQSSGIFGPVPISPAAWRGRSVYGGNSSNAWSRQRRGDSDTSQASDWIAGEPELGVTNSQISSRFQSGFGAAVPSPSVNPFLVSGVWSGSVNFTSRVSRTFLEASAGNARPSRSALFDVQDKPYVFLSASKVREGGGTVPNDLTVRLQVLRTNDTMVFLSVFPASEAQIPQQVTIPAGQWEVKGAVIPNDDDLLDGSRNAQISGTSEGLEVLPGVLAVLDNETAALSVNFPPALIEGQDGIANVASSKPPDVDISVAVLMSPSPRFLAPPVITIPAGQTNASFTVLAVENGWIDSPQEADISVSVDNWTPSSASFALADNESTNLQLTLPATTAENAGTLTNAGRVTLAGNTRTNLTVLLSSAPVGQIVLPDSVTIPAGQSNVTFSVTVLQDALAEGRTAITATTTASGYGPGSAILQVDDDDPASFRFVEVPSPQFVGIGFTNRVEALDANGQVLRAGSFNAVVSLVSSAATNPVASIPVFNGQGLVVVTPSSPGSASRLLIEGKSAVGISNPFNVLQPLAPGMSLPARDIAWIPQTQSLLATIPDGATSNAGNIVLVDVQTGALTTWAQVPGGITNGGSFGGRMIASPDGTRLFIAAGDGSRLQSWDLQTRSLVGTYPLADGSFIADMAVANAAPWRLAVALAGANGCRRPSMLMDPSFVPVPTTQPGWIHSFAAHPTQPETFYAYEPYQVTEWRTGPSGVLSQRLLRTGPYQDGYCWEDFPMCVSNGRLFSADGYTIDLAVGSAVGSMGVASNVLRYPKLGLVAADSIRNEVLIASPASGTTTRLQSFDATGLHLRREIILPLSLSSPRRLLDSGSNTVVLVASNQLSLIRWPVSPTANAITDVRLDPVSLTQLPRIGTNWEWSITVTNRGNSAASDVRVRAVLPPDTDFIQASFTGGSNWIESGTLNAHLLELPAGSSANLSLVLRPRVGGWTTNLFTVIANEEDAQLADNQSQVISFIATSGVSGSVEALRMAMRELVFDRPHRKLYALERVPSMATQTVLYSLDADTLVPEVVRILPGQATHLRISSNSRFLYAAVKSGRAMQRMDLLAQETDLVFETFNPDSGLKFWFFDFEVDPGDERTIVAVASSEIPQQARFETTAASFTDGVRNTRSVSFIEYFSTPGREGELEIDPATRIATFGTHAYPDRIVERLRLIADGLELVGQYNHEGLAVGFVLADERIYTAFGEELAVETGRRIRSLPLSSSYYGLVTREPLNDRILFLQSNGSSGNSQPPWQFRIFDRLTLGRVASIPVTIEGNADSLTLLDSGRVAIAAEGGKVIIVSSSAITGTAPTDLGVELSVTPEKPKVNDLVTVRVTITNRGPATAFSPAVTCELPSSFTRDSATPPPPSGNGAGVFPLPLLWFNPVLAPGGSATYLVRGRFDTAGQAIVAAGVADQNSESSPGDNRVAVNLPVNYALAPGQSALLSMKVSDAVYDSVRHRILALVTGDHPLFGRLAAIDPASGIVVADANVGDDPAMMGLADDGETLYVVIRKGLEIARVSVATLQASTNFSLHSTQPPIPAKALRIIVNPGAPEEMVVRQDDNTYSRYIGGAYVPPALPANDWTLRFFAQDWLVSADGSYPFLLARYHLTDSGLMLDAVGGPGQIESFTTTGGLVFARDGRLVDPRTFAQLGKFAGYGPAAANLTNRLVFYPLGYAGVGTRIFDLETQALLTEERTGAGFGGELVDLFWAGQDLLACRFKYGELAVIRTALVPTNPPADLAVGLAAVGPWHSGELCQWSVTVSNLGPNPAVKARVDLRMPAGMSFSHASIPPLTAIEPNISFPIGNLLPGETATILVSAVAQEASFAAELVASTRSSAMDSEQANNVYRLQRPIESSHVPNRVDMLPIAASDMVYDPASRMIFLTCPELAPGLTNRVVVLDPSRGMIVNHVEVPGRPGRLALSDRSEFLYVSLNSAAQVTRLLLPGLSNDLLFPTLRDDINLPRTECDMVVLSGKPGSIAFSRFGGGTPAPSGTWIFDDGVPRPISVAGGYAGVTFIEPGLAPTELLGLHYANGRLCRLSIIGDGVSLQSTLGDQINVWRDLCVGGTNILDFGQLFDRSTLRARGTLSVPFAPETMALSANGDRAVFIARSNRAYNPVDFAGFRTDTRELVGSIQTKGPVDRFPTFKHLLLWGDDGIAAMAESQLLLGHLDLAGFPPSDTDGDGLPDRWERDHGLSVSAPDADADPDADGASNLQEHYFGTDPQSALSDARIHTFRMADGSIRLTFSCAGGRHYFLESTTELRAASWTTVQEGISAGGLQVFSAQPATGTPNFYRVRIAQ